MAIKNLLFIFTDQQRYDTLSVYGNTKVRTPNLDKLASQSAVFKETYVSQPVCTPARATIMTGLYPHTHTLITNNLLLPEDKHTVAELVDKEDFTTGYIGKWHLGDEVVRQHGFGVWVSTEDYYRHHHSTEEYRKLNASYSHYLKENGYMPDMDEGDWQGFSRDFTTRIPVEHSRPAYLAGETDRFLDENGGDPFILYVNFLEPHPPYLSAYDTMYDPEEIDLPELFDAEVGEKTPLKYKLNQTMAKTKGRHFPLKGETEWRKQIARYWGCVTIMDEYVGKILDSLEERGLAEETAVVFTSDHGDMMGDFRMLAKGVMYQHSVRVPMLIKVPGITGGQKIIEGPVSQIDLAATVLDILDQPWEGRTQGKSLMPLIRGEMSERDDVFIEYYLGAVKPGTKYKNVDLEPALLEKTQETYGNGTAERTIVTADRWRLSLMESGEHELYDLNTDPNELKNLYYDPAFSNKVEELKARISDWQKETGDTVTF